MICRCLRRSRCGGSNPTSAIAWGASGRRPAGSERDPVRNSRRPTLAGCACRLWTAQDDLQPLHPLEPAGPIQPHPFRTGVTGRWHRQADDRCDASQGASHGGQPSQKEALLRWIGRSRGGLTTKLQVVCDHKGRPLLLHLSEGQANDHKTAAAVLEQLPPACFLLADRAYGSTAFRQTLAGRGVTPCIPPHAKHRVQHAYDPVLYRQRHRIENMFARLKAAYPHAIRLMRSLLPVSNRLRRSLHLLDQ